MSTQQRDAVRRCLPLLSAALLVLLTLLALPPAAAQRVETTGAETVLVDVAVVDNRGNHIEGLTAADFQVWEDGKEQQVDGIFTENGAASATSHYVVMLFDNPSMTAREQALAHDSANTFIDANTDPQRMTAVLNMGGGLSVTQTFTDDVQRIKQAVRGTGMGALALNQDSGVDRAVAELGARETLRSLEDLTTNLQQAPGRKTLLFFTAGFPVASDLRRQLEEAIDAANHSNVAIYPVNVQITEMGASIGTQITPQTRSAGRVGQSTVLRGQPNGASARPGLAGIFAPSDAPTPEDSVSDQAVMFKLAEDTGGFVVRQADDRATLSRVGMEQTRYYFLSYTPPDSKPGSCHELRVKVNRDNVDWRARGGYCRSTPTDLVSGNTAGQTLEARAQNPDSGQIPASVQLPYFYTEPNVARVHAALEIDPRALKFKRSDGKYRSYLEILGLAYRENGAEAARFSDTVELAFDKPELDAFQQRPYRYEHQFNIASGDYTLILVFNSSGEEEREKRLKDSSFARLEHPLTIAPFDPARFHISGLALSREFRVVGAQTETSLGIGLDELLFDDRKNLVADGVELIPAGSNRLPIGRQAGVYMEIYEPLLPGATSPDELAVAIQMRVLERGNQAPAGPAAEAGANNPSAQTPALIDTGAPALIDTGATALIDTGANALIDTGMMRVDLASYLGTRMLPLAQAIPLDGLGPGAYTLEIQAIDTSNNRASRTVNFELE